MSTATSRTVTGLTNGTEYTFRVAAVNHTRGDFSDSVAVTPSAVVSDPDFASVSLLLHGDGANESTTITDSSASPKTISRFGDAQVSTSQAQFGGASLKFDGSGDYLQIQDNSFAFGTSDFTIEFWVYFPSGFSYSSGMSPLYIGGTSGGAFSPFSIRDSSGNVRSYITGNSAWSIASNRTFTTIVRDTWLHWAITRSGSSWKTFENGVVKDSWTNSEPISNPEGQGDVLLVARATTDGPKEVQCFIDDLRITAGVARTITVPTAAFPDAGPTPSAAISVDYLVIAGGGGGGAGGGGGGGYRSSVIGESSGGGASAEALFEAVPGTAYTVTVGGGGSGGAYTTAKGVSGSNSVFASITSDGGGGGAAGGNAGLVTGLSGGSGGGGGAFVGGSNFLGGDGIANQGFAGGVGRPTSGDGAGGGGGAGGAGSNGYGGNESGGNGGAGLASEITGSSVSRAGGGGGGPGGGGSGGTATAGGGNASATASATPSAGTANTGGGGGGHGGGYTGSQTAGGSGVVIIRAPQAAASTTGSPAVTTDGSDTIYTFTGSGSITF